MTYSKVLLLGLVAPSLALAQITISGSSQQLTTNPFDQTGPSISGNIVAYTDYRLGPTQGEVYYHDLSTGFESNLTTANLFTNQVAADVSGNTVVYTESSAGSFIAKAVTIGGSPVTCGSGDSFSPGIDGTLVAWADGTSGTTQIFALDTSHGSRVQLTGNPANNNSLTPNVSGRNIVYSTGLDAKDSVCQVFVQNFDTRTVTQITHSATGCNAATDISGNNVVYQANRDGTQNIYVFDLGTSTETRVSMPGLQQNPHVSGDWVAFEDVASTGSESISSIRLYHIPSGTVLTAVQASTQLQSAFLNDIDGTRVVYTSAAAGNFDIYLYSFAVNSTVATDCSHLNGAVPIYTGSFTKQPGQSDDFSATFNAAAGPGLVCTTFGYSCDDDARVRVDGVSISDEEWNPTPGQAFVTLTQYANPVSVDTERGDCTITVSVYQAAGDPGPTDCDGDGDGDDNGGSGRGRGHGRSGDGCHHHHGGRDLVSSSQWTTTVAGDANKVSTQSVEAVPTVSANANPGAAGWEGRMTRPSPAFGCSTGGRGLDAAFFMTMLTAVALLPRRARARVRGVRR